MVGGLIELQCCACLVPIGLLSHDPRREAMKNGDQDYGSFFLDLESSSFVLGRAPSPERLEDEVRRRPVSQWVVGASLGGGTTDRSPIFCFILIIEEVPTWQSHNLARSIAAFILLPFAIRSPQKSRSLFLKPLRSDAFSNVTISSFVGAVGMLPSRDLPTHLALVVHRSTNG